MADNAAQKNSGEVFVISRVFDVPRDIMWKLWTEADHLMHWWGPKGCEMLSAKVDLKTGGNFLYGMREPSGTEMRGKFTYRVIKAPERLEFIVAFADAQGGITRHPFSPHWPLQTLSTVTFAAKGNKTEITVTWTPYESSDIERKTFVEGKDAMQQGWTGTFERLDAYLESQA